MANITPYTDQIANAVYGEEVRSSIINALKKVNDDNESYAQLKADVIAAKDAVDDQVEAFDGKVAAAEQVTSDLEAATSAGNTAKSNLVSATNTANTAKTNLQNATSTANTARTNLNSATSTANTAKSNLETATAAANTAKTNAETAKTNLDASITAAGTAKTQLDNTILSVRQERPSLILTVLFQLQTVQRHSYRVSLIPLIRCGQTLQRMFRLLTPQKQTLKLQQELHRPCISPCRLKTVQQVQTLKN